MKFFKKILTVLVLTLSMVTMVACGKKDDDDNNNNNNNNTTVKTFADVIDSFIDTMTNFTATGDVSVSYNESATQTLEDIVIQLDGEALHLNVPGLGHEMYGFQDVSYEVQTDGQGTEIELYDGSPVSKIYTVLGDTDFQAVLTDVIEELYATAQRFDSSALTIAQTATGWTATFDIDFATKINALIDTIGSNLDSDIETALNAIFATYYGNSNVTIDSIVTALKTIGPTTTAIQAVGILDNLFGTDLSSIITGAYSIYAESEDVEFTLDVPVYDLLVSAGLLQADATSTDFANLVDNLVTEYINVDATFGDLITAIGAGDFVSYIQAVTIDELRLQSVITYNSSFVPTNITINGGIEVTIDQSLIPVTLEPNPQTLIDASVSANFAITNVGATTITLPANFAATNVDSMYFETEDFTATASGTIVLNDIYLPTDMAGETFTLTNYNSENPSLDTSGYTLTYSTSTHTLTFSAALITALNNGTLSYAEFVSDNQDGDVNVQISNWNEIA